jgi:hypothetical protein
MRRTYRSRSCVRGGCCRALDGFTAEMKVMEHVVLFGTDTATLAAFDPALLAHRLGDDCDWWCENFTALEEFQRGEIALVGLGGDGVFKVRLTDGDLTPDERSYATESLHVGVVVTSGHLFVGAGEELPGEHLSPSPEDPREAKFFMRLAPGAYSVEVYGITWTDSPDWYSPPGSPVPESAPADVVLRLNRRESEFTAPGVEPRLFVDVDRGWLFPEEPRRLGPVPGMILRTSVVRRREEFLLKPCGPLSYRPVIKNMFGYEWREELDVRVLSVNHESQEFEAEVVQRLGTV